MTHGPIVFTDLDDTIFSSPHHYPGRDTSTLTLGSAEGVLGAGYLCERKSSILKWLQSGATVIPVTARALDSYQDVVIPFTDGAVVANGAVILNPDGSLDTHWEQKMESVLFNVQDGIKFITNSLMAHSEADRFKVDLYYTNSYIYGMTVKAIHTNSEDISQIHTEVLNTLNHKGAFEFVRHNQVGEWLGFMPHGIGKGPAVEYLLNTRDDFKGRSTIGMGDANTDLEFMQLCDVLVMPTNSGNGQKILSHITSKF
jgi:HAD superfamily hydrolase (TIGR01484 family)